MTASSHAEADHTTGPRTIAQKILAAHGVHDVSPGSFGLPRVDLVMANDVSGSVALGEFERIGAERVFDSDRVALFVDHFAPAKDVRCARRAPAPRRYWARVPESIAVRYTGSRGPFVTGKDLILAYIGRVGVSGATYAALEFSGPVVDGLSIDERMALCNMAVEAGAKTGIVAADRTTLAWLSGKMIERPLEPVTADPDAGSCQPAGASPGAR